MSELGERASPLLDRDWLSQFQESLRAANGLLLCLDFDGTLAPIVEDPDDATMAPGNRKLLQKLADDPSITVAIVSGRSLADLREFVGLDGIHYAGNHGLEWLDSDGRLMTTDMSGTQRELQDALDKLRSLLSDISGCIIEDKALTATVHYRQVADGDVPKVTETTEAVVQATTKLQCRPGKQCLEIRPEMPAGKDRIVNRLRDRYPDFVPLFVGDDVTDEDGFRAVGPDGYAVLVGERQGTEASVIVPNPDGVTMLLAWLVHMYVNPANDCEMG